MGKNRQQLMLEEYQESNLQVIKIEVAAEPDTDADLGSLPGCLGYHGQPEQGYVCSTCYHQRLCRKTTPTATIIVNKS